MDDGEATPWIFGFLARMNLTGIGNESTHGRIPTLGKTESTRWAAVSAILLPPQEVQNSRFLQE